MVVEGLGLLVGGEVLARFPPGDLGRVQGQGLGGVLEAHAA